MNTDTETKEIYLAGGCFWGTQHFLSLVEGVTETEVGFANSITVAPGYKEVCTGRTNAAETVRVRYNPDIVSLRFLLSLYFKTIDPTSVNRQGHDTGTQYRTGIYYTDPTDLPTIASVTADVAAEYSEPLAVEILPLENFYPAEDYHQDYLVKNPEGYCHLHPDLFELARHAREKKI